MKIVRGQSFYAVPDNPEVHVPNVCSQESVANRHEGWVTLDSPVPGTPYFWFVTQGEVGSVYSILELRQKAPA